ncbi:MAG: hemolysin family protein [Armatimonadota bacterium]|nr:hemolysin family protein [Armatimonadota bacterium]MDR7413259.1 hemolysin family protein [Armatimonadota bacterium]MDR7428738.1 hemolysin family protein [Armatimonadota bacterium]MDR7431331.1 hemolysin family protein [Armatimonadota bacterium]MDR7446207.1 hemolysin family protein [Armatimonadota bacterium]
MAWYWEGLVVLALILVNGLFAAAEMSVVTARPGLLEKRRRAGDPGAGAAFQLLAHRDRFLAAVQVGITLVGTLAGVYSGARLAEPLAEALRRWPAAEPYAGSLAVAVVVAAVTFASLVFGELVPKKIALARSEDLAARLAPVMTVFARTVAPLAFLLAAAVNAALWVAGQRGAGARRLTVEEFGSLVEEGLRAGLIEEKGARVLEGVLKATGRVVAEVMTPRTELVAVPVEATVREAIGRIRATTYSRFPVYRGDLDHIVGVLFARDLVGVEPEEPVAGLMRPALAIPETVRVLEALKRFQEEGQHAAVVLDEYGGTAGWVTLEDLLEELVGEIPSEHGEEEPGVVVRADGSLLVDGRLPLHQLLERLGLREEDVGAEEAATAAGLVLQLLGRIPSVGDRVVVRGYTIEVVDLDGPRIDKLLVTRTDPET